MAESVFGRVRRVVAASVEDIVDAMERAGGSGVMREAIREVDRVLDEVRAAREAASARRIQASRQARMFRERAVGLDEKARFALGEKREDLAEMALSRQIDFEAQAGRLDEAGDQAASEAERLEACLAALAVRKQAMEEELAAWETARREVCAGGGDAPAPRIERRVAQAEAAFARSLKGAGGVDAPQTDAKAVAGVAEIDLMQRRKAVAQRMEALRAAHAEA